MPFLRNKTTTINNQSCFPCCRLGVLAVKPLLGLLQQPRMSFDMLMQLNVVVTLVPEAFFYTIFFISKFAIEAPSPREKKASGQDRWESHFHAGSALDSCQRCHFLLTNHKGGSDLQFVDRAGWVSSPLFINKLLRRERRGAFAVFTSC